MTKQTAWIPVRGQTTSRILKSYLEGSSGLWMSSMGCSNSGGGRSLPVTNSTGIDYQIDLLKLVWIGIWICSILGTPQRSDTQITLYRWTSPLSGYLVAVGVWETWKYILNYFINAREVNLLFLLFHQKVIDAWYFCIIMQHFQSLWSINLCNKYCIPLLL